MPARTVSRISMGRSNNRITDQVESSKSASTTPPPTIYDSVPKTEQ